MTASLGVLSVPPVGVLGSVVLLGERPTLPDMLGFALILLASACVLLVPAARRRAAQPT
jgi:drug/metabolite transporter (DMT)-like permease